MFDIWPDYSLGSTRMFIGGPDSRTRTALAPAAAGWRVLALARRSPSSRRRSGRVRWMDLRGLEQWVARDALVFMSARASRVPPARRGMWPMTPSQTVLAPEVLTNVPAA